MNDRELTELAAKAAECYDLGDWDDKWNCLTNYEGWTFDPLTDDGDALRLAVKLEMTIRSFGHLVSVMAPHQYQVDEYTNGDTCAATRRAIVRAAAEIGRTMNGDA